MFINLLSSTNRSLLSLSLKRRNEAQLSGVALIAQQVGSFVWHWILIETVSSYCWRRRGRALGRKRGGGGVKKPHATCPDLFIALPGGWTLNFSAVNLSQIYKTTDREASSLTFCKWRILLFKVNVTAMKCKGQTAALSAGYDWGVSDPALYLLECSRQTSAVVPTVCCAKISFTLVTLPLQ